MMPRKRLNALKRLVLPSALPVRLELVAVQVSPLRHEESARRGSEPAINSPSEPIDAA
jgi:hypothetical protein